LGDQLSHNLVKSNSFKCDWWCCHWLWARS